MQPNRALFRIYSIRNILKRREGEEKEVGEKKREKEWKGKGKMFKKTAVGVGKSELESR